MKNRFQKILTTTIWILIVALVLTGLSAYLVHRRMSALQTDIQFHQAELARDETRRKAEQAILRALNEAAQTNDVLRRLVLRHGIRLLPDKPLREES